MTQRLSSEVRKVRTRSFPETPTGQSAPAGVLRRGEYASLARGLGADFHDDLGASWIDRLVGLTGSDVQTLLDALDDRAAARAERLRRTELQLVHERALLEALAEEQVRLRDQIAQLEERITELDAEMHLALARDAEDAAQAAILRIIPDRRQATTLGAVVGRLERARRRLDSTVSRREARLRRLRAPRFVPPPDDVPQAAAARSHRKGLF